MNSYEYAIECLNSRKAPAKANLKDMQGPDDMVKWLELCGHSLLEIDQLNAIHVAGTNGKGSTCAFTESILRAQGVVSGYPSKIGLYTSPHLLSIRERIRINGEPLPKTLFATRFFEIWDVLPQTATSELDIPRYLQLLALLSFHVFIRAKVDVAIFEAHLGGEFDATNIIENPLVTAITPISMDHVPLLGRTLEEIAWQKGGIFKTGGLAFSALQWQEVTAILLSRAEKRGTTLRFIGVDVELPRDAKTLKPEVQRINCSLALAIVRAWILLKSPDKQRYLSSSIEHGIDKFSWPGRFQEIDDQTGRWYLDGAHNETGLRYAVQWFAEVAPKKHRHFSKRDATKLLQSVMNSLTDNDIQIETVIFTSYELGGIKRIDRNLQNTFSLEATVRYVEAWRDFDPTATVLLKETIQGALDFAKTIGSEEDGMQTLIIGSLHLVSGALCLLLPETE